MVSDIAEIETPRPRTNFNDPEAAVQFSATQRICTMGLYRKPADPSSHESDEATTGKPVDDRADESSQDGAEGAGLRGKIAR